MLERLLNWWRHARCVADPESLYDVMKCEADLLPRTYAAIRIVDRPPESVEVQLSSAIPKMLYPGVRQWAERVVERELEANPSTDARDWDAVIRAADWGTAAPFLHYPWDDLHQLRLLMPRKKQRAAA